MSAATASMHVGSLTKCRSSSTSTTGLVIAESAAQTRGMQVDQTDRPGVESASNTDAGTGSTRSSAAAT